MHFKKSSIIYFVFAILLFTNPTWANSQKVTAPQWSEICPYDFLNARALSDDDIEYLAKKRGTAQTDIFYCKYHGTTAKIIRGITIIPALDCWMGRKIAIANWRSQLKSQNVENTYWAQRREGFYDSMKTCEGLSKDMQAMCYLKIKEIEFQKNNYRQQEQYNQTIVRQNAVRNMQAGFQTTQMRQINQNLNNINTNLQMLRY